MRTIVAVARLAFILYSLQVVVYGGTLTDTTTTKRSHTRTSDDYESMFGRKRVAGGHDARPRQFPSFVSLNFERNSGEDICSGVLIHKQIVLTAGHCVAEEASKIQVVTGIHAPISWDELNVKPMDFDKLCRSPNYSRDDGGMPYYDLGLVRLAEPVKLSDDVKLACLPDRPMSYKDEASTIGIGFVEGSHKKVKIAQVMPTRRFKCMSESPTRICLIADDEREHFGNVCSGDSGGPTLVEVDGKQCVYAITSFGDGLCYPNRPRRWFGFDVYQHKNLVEKLVEECLADQPQVHDFYLNNSIVSGDDDDYANDWTKDTCHFRIKYSTLELAES